MTHRPIIQLLIFYMLIGSLHAQTNKPQSTITQVPAPTATVVARPSAYSSTSQINYVRVRQAKYPFVQVNQFNSADMSDYSETTNYIDGLGRSLQTVQKQAAPGQKDMVTATQYDGFGRTTYQYLPFAVTSGSQSADGTFKTDPFTLQE